MSDDDCLKIPLFIPTNAKDAALVTSERQFARHNLPDRRHRLIFVREGRLLVRIGETTHVVDEGQVLLVKAGAPFTRIHPDDSLLRYYALRFSVSDKSAPDPLSMDIPVATTLSRPDLVEDMFRMMLDEQSDGLMEHRFAQMLFLQMLSEVADGERWRTASSRYCIPLVEHAKAHIRAHYGETISTATVAKAVDCSPGYLSRAFHSTTNTTVTAFIHEVRMFRARVLLTETNKPILHIAHECGFDNVGYFQRLFHRYEGMCPGDYRRAHSRIYTINI